MIISGGQSVIGGIPFIVMANVPTMGINSLAGICRIWRLLLPACRISPVQNG